MRRRQFITLLGGAAAAWPLAARGQDSHKRSLIGYLTGASRPPNPYSDIFLQGMRELGYVEGRGFDITYRGSDGYQDRLTARTILVGNSTGRSPGAAPRRTLSTK